MRDDKKVMKIPKIRCLEMFEKFKNKLFSFFILNQK